ncbi:DUF485 domain-containing protein [Streptomyces parvulus]|uniref:DUF485 domain-containing protein n=1 Tax=Streptomyces parvulus TaxID=146923 RepID=UPI003EBA738B
MTYDPSPSYPHHPPPAHQPPYQPPYQPPSPPPFPPHAPAPHQAPHRSRRRDPLGRHRDLRVLRGAYRWQRRTATLTALGYFTLFLLLSAYAPGFMTGTVTDGLPTGLLLALVQLPVTWLAIALYEQSARRRVDPLAERIRKEAELDARRGAGR